MKRVILILPLIVSAVLDASTTTLTQTVDLPLVIQGKTVGSMKLPLGAEVELVSNDGTNAVIRRGDSTYTIAASNLPSPSESHPSPSPTATPQVAVAASTPTPLASPQAIKAVVSLSPSIDEVNACLGMNMFPANGELWKADGKNIARSCKLYLESQTEGETRYTRLTTSKKNQLVSLNGDKVSHIKLTTTNGIPSFLAIFFNNKGNYSEDGLSYNDERAKLVAEGKEDKVVIFPTGYEKGIADQQPRLKQTLTDLFKTQGVPSKLWDNSGLEEDGMKWEWNDTVFFLSLHPKEYNALRILSKETFQSLNNGSERNAVNNARRNLASKVSHLEDGSVILNDFPFRSQGNRGYCTSTSFERMLKRNGVERDTDLLAIGTTAPGGGGYPDKIVSKINNMIHLYGMQIQYKEMMANITLFKELINKGQPIVIGLWTDSRKIGSHCCCIVGYNDKTQQVLLSDSNWNTQKMQGEIYKSARNETVGTVGTVGTVESGGAAVAAGRWMSYKEATELIKKITYIE